MMGDILISDVYRPRVGCGGRLRAPVARVAGDLVPGALLREVAAAARRFAAPPRHQRAAGGAAAAELRGLGVLGGVGHSGRGDAGELPQLPHADSAGAGAGVPRAAAEQEHGQSAGGNKK